MTHTGTKVKAICDWNDCWTKDQAFELRKTPQGYAYVLCNDLTNGPHHTICDDAHKPLTPADIIAGKSDQFICV